MEGAERYFLRRLLLRCVVEHIIFKSHIGSVVLGYKGARSGADGFVL